MMEIENHHLINTTVITFFRQDSSLDAKLVVKI